MSQQEAFKPISVKSPASSPVLFKLRCLVDLQLSTIVANLRPALSRLSGRVLDVGAGESPWRAWLPANTSYQGIDVGNAYEFGMSRGRPDIVYYDGGSMPFADRSFGSVLCIEVLEHAPDPQSLIAQIARVLKPDGVLLLTVPWSARQHHLPHDYHRFTRMQLKARLTVLTIRLLAPGVGLIWRLPLGLMTGVLAAVFIAVKHISDALAMGLKLDPLGYFVHPKRTGAT